MDEAPIDYTVVVPTVGRPSLRGLLESLRSATGPRPHEVILVDDRRASAGPLPGADGSPAVRTLRCDHGGGRGPAAARNLGWRAAKTEWVAFLDDDVVVGETWAQDLARDLAALPPEVGASQGRIVVPLPEYRRPTDWERNVAGLAHACWATADMAYRRSVLDECGGFCERFRRAFREDSDLGLRVTTAGYLILQGERIVHHPVRPADRWVSLRMQAGNADDVLMRARHGRDWRERVHAEPGRSSRHMAVTMALAAGAAGAASGRRRPAALALAAGAAGITEFAASRIRPGPRTAGEVLTMAATSCAIPPAATFHMARGWADVLRAGGASTELRLPHPTVRDRYRFGPVPRPVTADPSWAPKAVLFDRDGTLIVDKHYLSCPDHVELMPGARMAVSRAKQAGLATAVVTNQSGVGRGLMTRRQMEAVNQRVDELIGPFDWWGVCCHAPDDGCDCRKPAAGLILKAAAELGVAPPECAVIGDTGGDLMAARAAGARAVLVPTRATRPAEIRDAAQVAPDLLSALDLVLGGRC